MAKIISFGSGSDSPSLALVRDLTARVGKGACLQIYTKIPHQGAVHNFASITIRHATIQETVWLRSGEVPPSIASVRHGRRENNEGWASPHTAGWQLVPGMGGRAQQRLEAKPRVKSRWLKSLALVRDLTARVGKGACLQIYTKIPHQGAVHNFASITIRHATIQETVWLRSGEVPPSIASVRHGRRENNEGWASPWS